MPAASILIIGDIMQTSGSLIVGFIIGMINDYRIILIGFCFTPFSVAANILVNKSRISGRQSFRSMNIEAGSILSESVINTKSIFALQEYLVSIIMVYIRSLRLIKIMDYINKFETSFKFSIL